MREFMSFLALPNVASDSAGIMKNAAFIIDMMRQRGISNVRMLEADDNRWSPPAIFGEKRVPGAARTLIFYAHYDGQPVNPDQWANGLEPFTPKVYSDAIPSGGTAVNFRPEGPVDPNWRVYARGASDDKAGVIAILNAYEALERTGTKLGCNIKFFFEGEEEAGSPHLSALLGRHAELLRSDLWIICDGPVHQTGRKIVSFGVRGDAHLELKVYGPKRPLHSGHYGNWAPNPALTLAKLLASMKDDAGRVTIRGFYDDVTPLSETERAALTAMPPIDEEMRRELGLAAPEMAGVKLAEAITMPSLNINGMASGNVGKLASNQIPTSAEATLDLRLVVGNDWRRQQQKVVDHIRAQGFHIVDHDPDDEERQKYAKLIRVVAPDNGYNAQRTPMDHPLAESVIAAVTSTSGAPPVLIPTSGGSLPLYLIHQRLNAQAISVPIANHDNNQHAENENIRLRNLFEGIETIAAVMRIR